MKKTTAYKMIRTLGAASKKAMAERGIEHEVVSDLIAGLGGYKVMMMSDDDIPNIEKAYEIVAADVANWMIDINPKAPAGAERS
ncbi:MAG: hypothetical protein ACPGR4_03945 [Paracoccaceae bacterium]